MKELAVFSQRVAVELAMPLPSISCSVSPFGPRIAVDLAHAGSAPANRTHVVARRIITDVFP